MKKFTQISDKNTTIDFDKDEQKELSNDINILDDQVEKKVKLDKLSGEWEIVNILDVSMNKPITEAIIINAELGKGEIKRGDFIYITAQIKKPNQSIAYHNMQMGVIKVRVVDIYNTMAMLNNLR
ncbi:MAG: hypothetical protein M0R46_13280 [Candidatus Muirbacterium halophilum]|nr:hypothetical protein [Candidatus Muirbacterium halophilum]